MISVKILFDKLPLKNTCSGYIIVMYIHCMSKMYNVPPGLLSLLYVNAQYILFAHASFSLINFTNPKSG